MAPRKFWQTIQRLRKGKQGIAQAMFSREGKLLTQTGDVIGRWKEHFDVLNLAITSSAEEFESEDFREDSSISLTEGTEVVKKFLSSKVPGMNEIHLEMLQALDIVGLSWLTNLSVSRGSRGQYLWSGRVGWWFPSSRKGTEGCAPVVGVLHF